MFVTMDKRYIFTFLLLLTVLTMSAQNVSNVSARQVGKVIEITYDLDKAADITVLVSTSSDEGFFELEKVTGDVGKTVGPGHKTVIWDVQAEMEELIGNDIAFMVRVDADASARWHRKQRHEALKAMPFTTFVTLNAAYSPQPQWSYGFKVGQMKVVGWYASLMTNFHFKGWNHPFAEGHDYGLTDRKSIRLSAQAGLVVRPCKPMSLLFGIGYGYRTLTYKSVNEVWYSYPKYTRQGVDASFGLLFDIKGFVITAEAVTTNFQTIEAKVGLGYSFPTNVKKTNNQTVKVLK